MNAYYFTHLENYGYFLEQYVDRNILTLARFLLHNFAAQMVKLKKEDGLEPVSAKYQ